MPFSGSSVYYRLISSANKIALGLWPVEDHAGAQGADDDDDDDDAPEGEEVDLERQIAQELASIQKPRKEQRFGTSLVRLFAPYRSHARRTTSKLFDEYALRSVVPQDAPGHPDELMSITQWSTFRASRPWTPCSSF